MKTGMQPAAFSEDQQWREVKALVDKLILAVKNTSFYPRHHAVSQKSVADFYQKLKTCTDAFGTVVLEVGKTEILFQGSPLYQSPDMQSNPAYLWYRDGLQWLAFSRGISHSEVLSFLDILKSRRLMEDESKADIVTELWEAGLTNIKYSTSNVIWKDEPLLEVKKLAVTGDSPVQASQEEQAAESILDSARDQVLTLTSREIETTRQMVCEEEARTFDRDVFEVLLTILQEQNAGEDFTTVLDIMQESFKRSVSRGEFTSAARFLQHLHEVRNAYKNSGSWALAHLEDFFLMISGPRGLSGLKTALPRISGDDWSRKAALEQMLGRLAPEAVMSITPLVPATKDKDLRTRLLRTIQQHAENDLRPLVQLARQGEPEIRHAAVSVLALVSKKDALPVILEASRANDASLRKTAVKALIRQKPPLYEQVLPFIKDPEESIRQAVFAFLAKQKDAGSEEAIRGYLENASFSAADRACLLLLYRALGECAGPASLAFLSQQLLKRPWQWGKLRSAHRTGAAAALAAMQIPEAEKIRKKAAKSPWPPVRRAVKQAGESLHGATAQ